MLLIMNKLLLVINNTIHYEKILVIIDKCYLLNTKYYLNKEINGMKVFRS